MSRILLLLTLFVLNSCVSQKVPPHVHSVSLPTFPVNKTDYEYRIRLSEHVTDIAIFWYYETEERHNIIYRSGVVPIVYGNVETTMYFPWRGQYVLVILTQNRKNNHTQKYRKIYRVSEEF